jgi:uncharacterized protein (DUF305 family)
MLRTVTPEHAPDPTEPADDPGDDTGNEVLPWWRNPVNLVVTAIALAVLAGALGWVVGNNRALPDPTPTDTGFLQDMRVHHEQAVQMSLIFLDRPDTDPALQTIAREIVVGQNIEIGRMIQLLRDFGASEVNVTDTAMTWMDEPVALDRMPGLATAADIDTLRAATGAEANQTFVTLMTVHHQGGIHMAEHAVMHAGTDEVQKMAASMVKGQRGEIDEMATLLAASQN